MTRGGEEEQVGQLFLAAPTISSSAVSDELVVVDETDNEEDETDDDGGVCSENETVIRESPPPPPPQPRTLVGINNIIPHPHPPPPPSNLPDLLDEFKQLCSETKTLQFPIVAGLAAAAADATTKTANLEKKTVRKFTPAEDEVNNIDHSVL